MKFGIRLDKNAYEAGETANGVLIINSNKSLKVRKLKFSVYGKERYEAGMSGEYGHSSEKYDIFFSEELTPQLKPTFAFSQAADDLEIRQGSYSVPFHFSLPATAVESYQGKQARIMYEVEVLADMGRWKRDYHHRLPFAVINPRMDYKIGDRYYLDKEQEKKEDQKTLFG